MELGVAPGRQVGRVLEALLNAVMDGDVVNEREALLAWSCSSTKDSRGK